VPDAISALAAVCSVDRPEAGQFGLIRSFLFGEQQERALLDGHQLGDQRFHVQARANARCVQGSGSGAANCHVESS